MRLCFVLRKLLPLKTEMFLKVQISYCREELDSSLITSSICFIDSPSEDENADSEVSEVDSEVAAELDAQGMILPSYSSIKIILSLSLESISNDRVFGFFQTK